MQKARYTWCYCLRKTSNAPFGAPCEQSEERGHEEGSLRSWKWLSKSRDTHGEPIAAPHIPSNTQADRATTFLQALSAWTKHSLLYIIQSRSEGCWEIILIRLTGANSMCSGGRAACQAQGPRREALTLPFTWASLHVGK